MTSPLRRLWSFMRPDLVGMLARRAAGLRVWSTGDYLPEIPLEEAARLRGIADGVRGTERRQVIFVHGVLPRSGTNLVANALALHPDIEAFPDQLWEFPLLHTAPGAAALREEVLSLFPGNEQRVGRYDLLAFLASGWLADLQSRHPTRDLLLKSPHVRQLSLFRHVFPGDRLVVCLRDGRDVLASSAATFGGVFGGKSFRQTALEWAQATEAALEIGRGSMAGMALVRFEDMVERPAETVASICRSIGLDASAYPYDALAELPVFGSSTNTATGDERWQPVDRASDFAPIGRWKDWPEKRKAAFERLAGETSRKAGYG